MTRSSVATETKTYRIDFEGDVFVDYDGWLREDEMITLYVWPYGLYSYITVTNAERTIDRYTSRLQDILSSSELQFLREVYGPSLRSEIHKANPAQVPVADRG